MMIIRQIGKEILMDPYATYVFDLSWNRITDIDFSECETLKDIDILLPKNKFFHVIADGPLSGKIYARGNDGIKWEEIGQTIGYA